MIPLALYENSTLRRLMLDESGSALVEYGVVLSLISAAAVTILVAMGASANTAFTHITSSLDAFQNAPPP